LIGPNGGGKTTLLRTLLGMHFPSRGSVTWSGSAASRGIRRGYVPQKCEPDRACPLSAREVLQQGAAGWLPLSGRRRARVEERTACLLAEEGLGNEGGTRYVDLSGGQQRRLLLARALIGDPDVLLLDEPTAGVDVEGRDLFAARLREIAARGVAVILVSHDLPLVIRHADRLGADTAVGACYVASFALGVLLLSWRQRYTGRLEHLFFGTLLAVQPLECRLLALLALVSVSGGLALSNALDAPPGPAAVLIAFGLFAAGFGFRRFGETRRSPRAPTPHPVDLLPSQPGLHPSITPTDNPETHSCPRPIPFPSRSSPASSAPARPPS
jgi:ABC-type nitrate/sulfonate/bicarbonate transport system ATPase subunit